MKILVTGVSGFVGSALLKRLQEDNECVIGIQRKNIRKKGIQTGQLPNIEKGTSYIEVEDIANDTDWQAALTGVDIVVHLAARVHVMQEYTDNPLDEYRDTNTAGTLNLAHQATKAGVDRFIFVSTIKVNGEETRLGYPFTEEDKPQPTDPYAVSKYEAEQGLFSIASESNMDTVVIRPPLVYGPGVKANFLAMMSWLHRRIPLPFGALENRRSMVALDNLVDLIVTCIRHPNAANQIFFVSDGEDLSTTELLFKMGNSLGIKSRLFPINQKLLKTILVVIGKKHIADRLCSSLQVDISKAKRLLNWSPPISVSEGLKKTANDYLEST